ncbi:gem-associated protein 6 [Austrofundulus limnaeus]|uniref:Gem-associated protein 6 n=1 Tax=Austrofundulus limnaeus TaxID=52670 RepID=A0A2I4DAI6_AUSLI|nr:PREDICTED: gem-associated protein 6 [Austrofundulus limnaeus]
MQRSWLLSGPLTWFRFINKQVRVKAGNTEEHLGWLLTVDPVSGSVVLVDFREDRVSVNVVMGHAVRDVEVLQEADSGMAERLQSSVVLVDFREDRVSVNVVMGHAVRDVEVLQEADSGMAERLQSFFLPLMTPVLDPEELRLRRTRVRQWLEKNRLPVDEDRDKLSVAGVLTIMAPYRPEDCCSSNQIILDRIQKLIQVHPETGPCPAEHSTGISLDLDQH